MPAQPQVSTPATVEPRRAASERLRELERLRSEGLITEQEYNDRRAKVLEGL
jgi:hypothetical protein